jgi:predicted PurR-regulated permease PerM
MENPPQNMNISISSSTIIRIIIWVLIVFAAIKLSNILLIILTAIVIASFIESAVNKFKPYLKNRTLIVFCVYALVIGILIAISSIFLPLFINEMSSLVDSLGKYIPNTSILNTFQPETITGAKEVASTISSNSSIGDVIKSGQSLINNMSGGFFNIFGKAFGGIFNLILIFILSLFLSLTDRGVDNFLRVITPAKKEEYVIGLWQRTEKKIGLWFQGQLLLGIIMGVLVYLGLTIMGVKYALLIAIITAICELIPYGIFIATIPAVIFSYLDGGITLSLVAAGLFLVFHQFENYLIYPLIVKNVIGISPLVVILSVLIGGQLAGFWGVVLAIPCAVLLLEFLDDVEKKKILSKTT